LLPYKKKEQNIFENINYFNITYRFRDEEIDKNKEIAERLSKISFSNFDKVIIDYNIEIISLMEDLSSEFMTGPNIKFQLKNFEVFLSRKKIAISFPEEKLRSGRSILRVGSQGLRSVPKYEVSEKKKEKEQIGKNLEEIESYIKFFILPVLLGNKIPEFKEISIIFEVSREKGINIEKLNNLIEKNLLNTKKIEIGRMEFEIKEEEAKYFYAFRPDKNDILCSFIYEDLNLSFLHTKIIELLELSFKKYKEIIKIMGL